MYALHFFLLSPRRYFDVWNSIDGIHVYTKERELKNEYRETVRVLQAEVRSGRIHM